MTISQERLKQVLLYNPITGIFTWNRPSKSCHGKKAGCLQKHGSGKGKFYIKIRIDNKLYYAHRLAFLYVNGRLPNGEIDHLNGDSSDNSIANLRDCDKRVNGKNVKLGIANTSGVMGVCFNKQCRKWFAQIKVDGKVINLGVCKSKGEAIERRKEAEMQYGFGPSHGAR